MVKFKQNITIIIAILLMMGNSACASSQEQTESVSQYPSWYVSADSGLNCRMEPTIKEGNIIKAYGKGVQLQIIGVDETGEWWQTWDGETQGWCYSTYFVKNADDLENVEPENEQTGAYIGRFYGTGYTSSPSENGGSTKTAMGDNLSSVVGHAIAADPKVIPMNTRVYIKGIGYRVVRDTGGAIKGNRIDILTSSNNESLAVTGYYDVYLAE